MKRTAFFLMSVLVAAVPLLAADAWQAPSKAQIDAIYPQVEALYEDIHRHPELSGHEVRTAATIADQLRQLGFEVTTGVGGTGVVGVLKNGAGPVVMIRAELDALPIVEKTGLPYASHATTHNSQGVEVGVMHACGHDLHMSIGIGTATLLARNKGRWHGTFIYVGQPAEEVGQGAAAMLKDGLFTRFPRPDFAIALHDTAALPAGQVGFTPGYAASAADSVDVTIFGRGGHGAMPQDAIDPIVIASRTVVAWQTIVSREIDPRDMGIITVGSIHGGTKHNIIPGSVHLQLTVRSYKPEVRQHLLSAIERIADGEAQAAGTPKKPLVKVSDSTSSVYNDPALTRRVAGVLRRTLGGSNVIQQPPITASDDFAEYGRAGVPSLQFELGAVDPQKFAVAQKSGKTLPGVHSPFFAPDREPSLKTGILAETAAILNLLQKK